MNVFRRFALRTLKSNPTRTAVTVIGIILSMSMFTAVAEAAYSGLQFLISAEKAATGSWHLLLTDLPEEVVSAVCADDAVRESFPAATLGWSELGSGTEYQQYLLVKAIDGTPGELLPISVVAGRMPENGEEILLPAQLAEQGSGGMAVKLGDPLVCSLGRRTADGRILRETDGSTAERPVTLTGVHRRAFTVVGFYLTPAYELEPTGCPSYTALTIRGADEPADSVLLRLTRAKNEGAFLQAYGNGTQRRHSHLLDLEGNIRDSGIRATIVGFAAALFVLIAFGSVSLIYNAFAISVSERTKQYGLLKSVGATRKQIRASVLTEALILAGAGVPLGALAGCLGIGVTLRLLRDSFKGLVGVPDGVAVQMRLIPYAPAILLAAGLCLLTILLSAWIPARRAMRLDPISAIRADRDIRISKRDVKTGGLTARLFGFEGMLAAKNFRRSRRRYRAVVLSLFMSVVLFVTATSFCAYIGKTFSAYGSGDPGCDLLFGAPEMTEKEEEALLRDLREIPEVESVVAARNETLCVTLPKDLLTEDIPADDGSDFAEVYCSVIFADEESFRAVCAENGVDPAPYYEKGVARALVCNDETRMEYGEDGTRYFQYAVLRDGALPLRIRFDDMMREFDGLIMYGKTVEADGKSSYLYYPASYIDSLPPEEEPDPAKGIRKTAAEATLENAVELRDVISRCSIRTDLRSLTIVLPASALDAFFTENTERSGYFSSATYMLRSPAHARAAESVRAVLEQRNLPQTGVVDLAERHETLRNVVTVINVFAYGFIALISLIAAANVFNTISTNIALRRREIAMLRSIGLSQKSFRRMMNYECLIYGARGVVLGLPVSFVASLVIWRVAGHSVDFHFYIPWHGPVIAVCSVFLVVFATMLYAAAKIRHDDPVEALRNENL